MTTLIIDEEFKNILPPLSEDEHLALEENITQWGSARDPILVWKEESIIIDGHHRHSVCEAYGLPFEIKFISFGSRRDAIAWAYRNQLGRRNLTPQKMRYLQGKISGAIVSERGNSKDKQVGELAKQQGVSKRTVYNSEKYAEKVDTLTEKQKSKVLSGEEKFPMRGKSVITGKVAKLSHPYRTATKELRRIVKEFEIISNDSTTGQYIATKMTRIKNNLEEAIDAINQCEPVEECDKCHGKTCNHCYGTGFLSRAARESRDK
tara:strand:- start:1193 stop:1981 length:789 start_codon:yes stop_codon:yes gene_type:complete